MIPVAYNAANVRLYAAGWKHCYKGPFSHTLRIVGEISRHL